jgi:hypothetical protein
MKVDSKDVFILKDKDLYFSTSTPLTYSITLSKDELSAVNNVKEIKELTCTISSYEMEYGYLVNIKLKGKITLIDDLTAKNIKYDINTDDYLNAALKDSKEDDIDIVADHGNYDFAPIVLALFYQAVPLKINYQNKYYSTDDYEVISEEEYNKRKQEQLKEDNPFSKLSELDLDD